MSIAADIQDYGLRVETGKLVEQKILTALRYAGMKIADPTSEEDTQDKVDGWIIDETGRHSLQIKYRETGDDILFEVMRDLDRNIPGRDSVSKAEYYLVVDRSGTGRLFLTAPIKELARQMITIAGELLNTTKTEWHGIGWQLRITIDRANGSRKLMAFFNPNKFRCLNEWNNLI